MLSLYSRVACLLRNKILSGQMGAGAQLPSEDELTGQFDVSKITIRHALSILEAEGLISRKRGKGTFVAKSVPIIEQFLISDKLQNIVDDALKYKSQVVSVKSIPVKEARIAREIRPYLNLSDEDYVTRIQRIRESNSNPIYFTENYFPTEIGQNIDVNDIAKMPLLLILKNTMNITITSGEMTIEAVPAYPDVADFLKCVPYHTLILRKIYYRYQESKPLEIVLNFMRSEYFKYVTKIDPTL